MRRSLLTVAASLGALASACAGNGTPPDAATLPLDCRADARIEAGAYRVENNTWGRGTLTGWTQCAAIAERGDDGVAARWTWSWPGDGDHVKSYPEVVYGHKPGYAPTRTRLPRRLDDIRVLRAEFDVASTRQGGGNLAFDLWLTDTAQPQAFAAPPITHEVMVWLDAWGGMGPGGRVLGRFVIGGAPYRVHVADKVQAGWRYVALVRSTPMLSGTVDLQAVLAWLKTQGLVSGREHLASIELGNEILVGSGETRMNRFRIDLQ